MTTSKQVIRTYLIITLLTTLATSLIWGINTLFMLNAGLSITEVFTVNAFFMVGQFLFEIPTGIVADSKSRKLSFLLGTITLAITTGLYYMLGQTIAPLWQWIAATGLLGLGFTFFSGAVEAWLVDALNYTKHKGNLEGVFAKGQIISGIAMLTGSIAGGIIAQQTSLGVPYIIRAVILVVTFIAGLLLMKDLGFEPDRGVSPIKQAKNIWKDSIKHCVRNPPVWWLMLAAPFTASAGFFAFYALQPYLLDLYGDPEAYGIAGIAAAVIAGAQIFGGIMVPKIIKMFKKRTTILLIGTFIAAVALFGFGILTNFWVALVVIVIWAIVFAATMPVRQAYLNDSIPSKQRATILSFDSLISSGGGAISQPLLGKAADVYSLSTAYVITGVIQLFALPFIYTSRKKNSPSDKIKK